MYGGLTALAVLVPVCALLWLVGSGWFGGIAEKARRFRRLPWLTQIVLAACVISLWVYGSTKTNATNSAIGTTTNETGWVEGGMTNGTTSVQQQDGGNTNEPPMMLVGGAWAGEGDTAGGGATALPAITTAQGTENQAEGTNFTSNELATGWVVWRVGTNEVWNFAMQTGATEVSVWRLRGAARDWHSIGVSNDWASVVTSDGLLWGNAAARALAALPGGGVQGASFGEQESSRFAQGTIFGALPTALGIVPECNWLRIAKSNATSRVWYCPTAVGGLVVTWQDALLGRATNAVVGVQAEFLPSGGVVYRYDLKELRKAGCVVPGEGNVTNLSCFVKSLPNGTPSAQQWVRLGTNVTSVTWYRIHAEDLTDADRDGDGIPTSDELRVYGTDPGLCDSDGDGVGDADEIACGSDPLKRDTDGDGLVDGSDPDPLSLTEPVDRDGDGIPDAYETHWFGGTNVVDATTERDATGFTLGDKILGGINPTNAVDVARIVSTNALVSWKLFDRFTMDLPSDMTNLVWERTFAVSRSSAWRQFFISAAPTNAAGWYLQGETLEWSTDTGSSGSASASSFGDSYRIPLDSSDLCSSLRSR